MVKINKELILAIFSLIIMFLIIGSIIYIDRENHNAGTELCQEIKEGSIYSLGNNGIEICFYSKEPHLETLSIFVTTEKNWWGKPLSMEKELPK